MSVMDLAGTSRVSGTGPVMLRALSAFDPYMDSNGYTYGLAERVSDGAITLVFARGSVADLVETHNKRSRIKWEKAEALKRAADETLTEPERSASAVIAAELSEALATLPKTNAQPTVHVARALSHWERVDTEPAPEPTPEPE